MSQCNSIRLALLVSGTLDSLPKSQPKKKGQRQKIENSENTGEREKEMMKSPLQEKKKKKRRRRSTDPLYNTCGLFWLLVGKLFEERRRKTKSRGIIIKCREK